MQRARTGWPLLYVDPERALSLAERRVHLQLRALGLMNAGVALFGATTVSGLVGAFLVQALAVPSGAVSLFMIAATGGALAVMLAAICALYAEGKCGREMVRLHHRPHGPLARQGMAISQALEGRKA